MSRGGTLTAITAQAAGFVGGTNMRDAITQLAPDECRRVENGMLDEKGGFSKRLGCLSKGTFGSSSDRVLSMYVFYRGTSDPQILIHTSAGKLYYTNDPTAGTISWTEIVSGLSTTAPMSFETFNGKVYMSNGVDDYASWSGTTRTAFASAPKGRYLRLWKDTMWVAGVTGLEDRIYSSNAGDAETFGVNSWVDIAKGDGDVMRALASDGLFLIVGKRNRSFIIYDPVTFANRTVDFEKGFESHFAVVQFESSLYFLSRRGMCLWLGDTPSQIISGKIDPLFDPSILNLNTLTTAYAYTHENRIGWALPEAGISYPTLQVEYYPRLAGVTAYGNRGTGPWAFQRMPAGVFARYRKGTLEYLYCSHNAANKVLQAFAAVGTDDGVTFESYLETGAFAFDQPTLTKYIRRIRFLGRGQFNCLFIRDFRTDIYKTFIVDLTGAADTWDVGEDWGDGNWGPEDLIREQVNHPDAYVRHLQFRFTDSETGYGSKIVPVGSVDYSLTSGEWAIYGYYLDGDIMGVRA